MGTSLTGYFLRRLALVAGVGLLPLLVLHAYVLHATFSQSRADARVLLHAASASSAVRMQEFFSRVDRRLVEAVRNLEAAPVAQESAAADASAVCERLLSEVREADGAFERVLLFSGQGRLMCSTQRLFSQSWASVGEQAWFVKAQRSATPTFFVLADPEDPQRLLAAFSQPVRYRASNVVFVAALPGEALGRRLQSSALAGQGVALLLDATSSLVAQHPPVALSPGQTVSLAAGDAELAVTTLQETAAAKEGAGRAFFAVTHPVPGTGLRVVAAMARDDIDSKAVFKAWVGAGATLAALLAGAVLAMVMARRLSRPVSSLSATVHALAHDNPESRADENLPGAFGSMAHELNELTDQRNEAMAGLESSNARLRRTASLYAARSAASRAIVQQLEPQELYEEICRICVKHGGAVMAWFGLVERGRVNAVAWGGPAKSYTDSIDVHHTNEGLAGPTVSAVNQGRPVICNDFMNDPSSAPWREVAQGFGVRASAAFPVQRDDGTTFGVLNLYYTATDVFHPDLARLVGELCGDIAYAVQVHERDKERERTLTALREAEQAQKKQELAEQANQAKTVFLSRISHELRSPLNAVLGFTQLLQMSARDKLDEDDRHKLDLIFTSGAQLRALIDDVLDVSRIEAGQLALDMKDVEIAAVANNVLRMSEAQAREKGVTLGISMDSAARTAVVHTDPVRLRQVLLNLVSNAIKYNKTGGRVTVAAQVVNARVELKVSDTGLGMSAQQMSQLFQPFNRLGRERSEISGTGIGLVLVRHLVALLGGDLDIQSTEGEGTVVRVGLPYVSRSALAPASKTEHALTGSGPEDDDAPCGLVLYVEDNPANVQLIRQLLARWPRTQLAVASTGNEGVELARQLRPDLVLLDLNLPGMPGEEVLRTLRADPAFETAAVVVLSASAMAQEKSAALALGADDYWTKPIDFVQVIEGVRRYLSTGHRQRRESLAVRKTPTAKAGAADSAAPAR